MQSRFPTEERQLEIAAAALRLAGEVGPALITTNDIATAVGISQGAVFKHFPTKDAIWLAALQGVHQNLLAALEAAAGAQPTALPALQAVFLAHVAYVIDHPGAPRLVFHELQQAAESPARQEVRALLQAYRRLLLRLLHQGVEQDELPTTLDTEAAATLFVGIVQGLVMQAMAGGRPAAMKTQADGVFAIYLRGIREAT
ncbi:MAG: TetR/AcrR family transcriptional regulator [Rubrivivax sp.]|nr:TetR/AcrR family transcriptional regulator [Rubrivivax sp.]